jgi:hypothetical protein
MNKLVRNIQKSSKYYCLEGLIVDDTENQYYVIWFKLGHTNCACAHF